MALHENITGATIYTVVILHGMLPWSMHKNYLLNTDSDYVLAD